VASAWKSVFQYDAFGRRRVRKEYTWQSSAWVLTNEVRYVYDGMLVAQERNGNNLALVSYTRGNDLSGSRQGAGGIGGLLARTDSSSIQNPASSPHSYYHADGNGNITAMVDTNGFIVAKYQYDPYGNLVGMAGPLAEANTFRFSSKEWHANSGLYYYGFRYYEPNLQRWLNRDPLDEDGGVNLYSFVGNAPMIWADSYGLDIWDWSIWDSGFVKWWVRVTSPLHTETPYTPDPGPPFDPNQPEGLESSPLGELLIPSGVGFVKCFRPSVSLGVKAETVAAEKIPDVVEVAEKALEKGQRIRKGQGAEQLEGIEKARQGALKERPKIKGPKADQDWEGAKRRPKQSKIDRIDKSKQRARAEDYECGDDF
jgi:RHS repeat-associated protein